MIKNTFRVIIRKSEEQKSVLKRAQSDNVAMKFGRILNGVLHPLNLMKQSKTWCFFFDLLSSCSLASNFVIMHILP